MGISLEPRAVGPPRVKKLRKAAGAPLLEASFWMGVAASFWMGVEASFWMGVEASFWMAPFLAAVEVCQTVYQYSIV